MPICPVCPFLGSALQRILRDCWGKTSCTGNTPPNMLPCPVSLKMQPTAAGAVGTAEVGSYAATLFWRGCLALLLSFKTAYCKEFLGSQRYSLRLPWPPASSSSTVPCILPIWPIAAGHGSAAPCPSRMLLGQLMQQGATLLTCCSSTALPCTCAASML